MPPVGLCSPVSVAESLTAVPSAPPGDALVPIDGDALLTTTEASASAHALCAEALLASPP